MINLLSQFLYAGLRRLGLEGRHGFRAAARLFRADVLGGPGIGVWEYLAGVNGIGQTTALGGVPAAGLALAILALAALGGRLQFLLKSLHILKQIR